MRNLTGTAQRVYIFSKLVQYRDIKMSPTGPAETSSRIGHNKPQDSVMFGTTEHARCSMRVSTRPVMSIVSGVKSAEVIVTADHRWNIYILVSIY